MWLRVCTLSHLCCTEFCGIIPRKSTMCFSSIRRFKTRSTTLKKKLPGGTTLFILFKIQNLLDVHDFSDQSTLELVTSMFLSVEYTTGFANYAKATTYFLVVNGKIRRNCSLFVCKVCCSRPSFRI